AGLAGQDDEPPRLGEMVVGSPNRGLQQWQHLRRGRRAVAQRDHALAGVDGLQGVQFLPPAIAGPARANTFPAILRASSSEASPAPPVPVGGRGLPLTSPPA